MFLQIHIGVSRLITQNQPYSKIRQEYHMDNPYPHTTKTTRDHEGGGIMETFQQENRRRF